MELDLWVVVAASRPDKAENVLGNYLRQGILSARLLIVENGDAVGLYEGLRSVDARIQSEAHHSLAKNAGLAWLRENHPGAYYVAMDDDDYYGTGYLAEHARKAERGVVRGKRNGWVQFDSGLHYFFRPGEEDDEAVSLSGGTIGGYVDEIPDFPVQVAEEHGFCEEARARGLSVRYLSTKHYCYSREGDPKSHAWMAREEKVHRMLGSKSVKVDGHWVEWVDTVPVQEAS
jgi:hypothetical protein